MSFSAVEHEHSPLGGWLLCHLIKKMNLEALHLLSGLKMLKLCSCVFKNCLKQFYFIFF